MYPLIDLHCDTLTKGNDPAHSLNQPSLAVAISKIPPRVKWAQCFAIFIPDALRGEDAVKYFDTYCRHFEEQMRLYGDRITPCVTAGEIDAAFACGKYAALLTVEGGCILKGDLQRIAVLRERGVRILTLVWNGANELGSGILGKDGLTDFGKACIPALEEQGILIDVSHLNDAGFADVAALAKKPFLATHSNARAVARHPRNLTDEQIRTIAARGGLVGMNFYTRFLREDDAPCTMEDLLRHIEHFLALGAEDSIALGSDYDGADLPECLNSVEKSFEIGNYLLRQNFRESTVEKIVFRNAMNFFANNLQ